MYVDYSQKTQNYIFSTLNYTDIYDISQQSRHQKGGGTGGTFSPKPGKFAKDEEQPAPQSAVSQDSNGKFKFFVNF